MSSEKRRSPFAIVPIEVLADERLTLRHIRVLVAILSFRSVDTGLAFPSREEIGERARLPVSRVSTITTELVNLGWLKKEGNGGRSRVSRYRFCVPENTYKSEEKTVTESVRVTKPVTVTDSALNGYRNSNETVTESVRGIEQTNTDHNKPNNSYGEKVETKNAGKPSEEPKPVTPKELETKGVDKEVALEFLALRRRKRATLTPLALAGVEREAEKAGMSLNAAMRMCVERGWQSLKASWVMRDKEGSHRQNGAFDPVAYVNRNRTNRTEAGGYADADVIDV